MKAQEKPPVRVLLAEDSGLMRLILKDILSQDDRLQLIDTAENGRQALEKIKTLDPDVVLCDLVMPDYDGVYLVKEIMRNNPKPIVLLSSLDPEDSLAVQALMAGAIDFVGKPKIKAISNIRTIQYQINEKLIQASKIDPSKIKPKTSNQCSQVRQGTGKHRYDIICVAASTGGPTAVELFVSQLPDDLTIPVVIVQHMPSMFLKSFRDRLQIRFPEKKINLAMQNQGIGTGIWIAPGDTNLTLRRNTETHAVLFEYTSKTFPEYNFPSANCLFYSVAELYGPRAIGIVLTGMGADGADGLATIHAQGGYTIAQDKASSVVYGMPLAAFKAGATNCVLPLEEIAPKAIKQLSKPVFSQPTYLN